MGGGSWTTKAYVDHSTTGRGFASMDAFNNASTQELYRSHSLDPVLNPYKVIRECCDSDEHPNTIPVILALDVTGSMGSAAETVAKQLGEIMEKLYDEVKDVEFMTMAIGDLSYDSAPIQASQFESDIRIAEQLEKIYFEGNGGGNGWESYTAAWYFGLYHTKLDCWKRGKKGVIITMGDEPLNPYLPKNPLERVLGQNLEADIETSKLYEEVITKFNVYHLGVNDRHTCFWRYKDKIEKTFGNLLKENYIEVNCNNLGAVISDIIINNNHSNSIVTNFSNGISW